MKNIIEDAIAFIEKRFEGDSSGHDFYHSIRVYHMATHIAASEAVSLETVQLAALLHDVDDKKLFTADSELQCAKNFMQEHRVDFSEQERICRIIKEVSFQGNESVKPSSLEGRIVQDADRLDAMGAIGIARTFAYGGSRGRSMHLPYEIPRLNMNAEEYSRNPGTSINHFYEKLLKLKDMMNTVEGKRIAEGRHQYMLQFLEEFHGEWNGNQ